MLAAESYKVHRVSYYDRAVSVVHRSLSTFCLVYALESTFSVR